MRARIVTRRHSFRLRELTALRAVLRWTGSSKDAARVPVGVGVGTVIVRCRPGAGGSEMAGHGSFATVGRIPSAGRGHRPAAADCGRPV